MNDITLDASAQEFEQQLNKSVQLILKTYQKLDGSKVFKKKSPAEIAAAFDEPMPEHPSANEEIWRVLEEEVVENATLSAGPNFYSYVLSPGNQMGLAGEMLSTFLNQNASKWHLGPAASEIEKITLKWISKFIGYDDNAGGIMVSGGSMANLTCLTVARNHQSNERLNYKGLYNQAPMMIYMTDQAHYCVDKAMAILGLGRDQIRHIPTDDLQQMRMDLLEEAIENDLQQGLHPFCVVGSAGTVNTGAIDPLNDIANLCEKYNLWFHIDAAYGGPAAGLSSLKESFMGLDRADSLALDPHKWLYVPIEAGCSLFKNASLQKETYSLVPEYLKVDQSVDGTRTDFMEYGPQLTRSFRALKVWITFKAYGADRIKNNISHDIRKVQYLRSLLEAEADFEILAPAPLSILCFRLNPSDGSLDEHYLNDLNEGLLHALEEDGSVFVTGTRINDCTALRVCIVNHRTQFRHIDKLVAIVTTKAKALLTNN